MIFNYLIIRYLYKIFLFSVSKFLFLIDLLFRKIFKRYQFLSSINDYIESRQYYEKTIHNKKIIFFCPSLRSFSRVQSLYTKEPETLNWMDSFQPNNSENIVFWDIGANISINNLESKISIFPLALSDKENIISYFNETKFSEGGSISNFNSDIDYCGEIVKENQIKNKYNLFGTSIDNLILNKIVKVPNYIKIDVDGIEHLILQGVENLLKNKHLKEFSIEMNPTYVKQYEFINNIMEENNFKKIASLNQSLLSDKNYKLKSNETVNEIFKRNN